MNLRTICFSFCFDLFLEIMFFLPLVPKYSFKNEIRAVVDIYFEHPYLANNKMAILHYSFNICLQYYSSINLPSLATIIPREFWKDTQELGAPASVLFSHPSTY